MPENSIIMPNNNGTAPGVIIETDYSKVILLPGPPGELIPMFEESVVPYLETLTSEVIDSKTVKICGVPESEVEMRIKDLIDTQTNPTLATYAKTGEVHVRVTASAESHKDARKLIKPVVKELKSRFGADVYTTEEDTTLEKAVVELLQGNGLTVTCAESCTGGMLSSRLINVPGVSEIFKLGLITYSNKAKRKMLGVKKSTLSKYSAVSEQTAIEMAKGAAFVNKADVAVAVTGYAGPDDNEENTPVGLVYIACNVKGHITVKEYHFKGNRAKIRESAASNALILMRSCVLEYYSEVTFGK
jgi:nicotinamide-nucleotide amidase